MIIGIDGNEANVQQQVGVSVYTTNLLRIFKTKADANLRFRVYLKNPPNDILPSETAHFTYHVIPGPVAWSQVFFPLYLSVTRNCDVLFAPAHYAPRFCPMPAVVTIHDLSYFYYPDEFLKKDLYKLKNWTQYSLEKAKKIICVSKTTRKDVVHWYNPPEHKLETIYNGYEKTKTKKYPQSVANSTDLFQKHRIKKKNYILYVGTLQPRKNVSTLIEAFRIIQNKHPTVTLVLAGKKGWLYDTIFSDVRRHGLTESVIFPGYVSDNDLIQLYRHALCYVLPSLYEGFGIPVLEAMAYGCPVIASQRSSLPEVGGNASLYFDPESPQELAEKISLFINDPGLRKEYQKKGKTHVTRFSWDTCAKQTLEVLRTVALQKEIDTPVTH